MNFGFRMQDFIPQARAHSLPDENPLPDVTLCPPAPARSLPDANPLPDVNSLLKWLSFRM